MENTIGLALVCLSLHMENWILNISKSMEARFIKLGIWLEVSKDIVCSFDLNCQTKNVVAMASNDGMFMKLRKLVEGQKKN